MCMMIYGPHLQIAIIMLKILVFFTILPNTKLKLESFLQL